MASEGHMDRDGGMKCDYLPQPQKYFKLVCTIVRCVPDGCKL